MEKSKPEIIKRFISRGIFPHQLAFTLLIPLRKIFLSQKKLIKRLELKDNYDVLEIGSGPGFFSIEIAHHLLRGRLVLADIQPEMLKIAKKRIEKKGLPNVEYYNCDGDKLEFNDESFDRAFMVSVIGEVKNKDKYLKEIYRILKSGGILSISELAGDPDKINMHELKELTLQYGFRFYKQFEGRNYTINFMK